MAYLIEVTYSNGYRCGCCSRDWEYEEEAETLEEALVFVPTELVDGAPLQFNGDMEVTEVEVKDKSSGEVIAWARASWSQGYGRGSGYSYTKWSGYRPDLEGGFEVIYDGGRKKIDRSWEEVLEEMKEKRRREAEAKAQRDLEDAQKRLRHYSAT